MHCRSTNSSCLGEFFILHLLKYTGSVSCLGVGEEQANFQSFSPPQVFEASRSKCGQV